MLDATKAEREYRTGAHVRAPAEPALRNAVQILTWSSLAMAGSLIVMLLSAALAYPLADHLGLLMQVAAHLALPLAAGVFKLGYVARLAALQALRGVAVD